jgi:anti-sigma regulatory factor (Ser/Thr protein kinase)
MCRACGRTSLVLRNDPAELPRLIAWAERFARRHALPALERARLSIILEELFTNAVKHGYDDLAPSGRVEVTLALEAGQLMIEFNDDGRPFDPLMEIPHELDQPTATRRIGGLGLNIVRSLTDDARYVREGDRNHLVLTRKILRPVRHDESA